MSLYNMINGVNPATFLLLPLLGKHPDEYPRFRDCFIGKLSNSDKEVDTFGIPTKELDLTDRIISVYTRVGGGNRDDYQKEIQKLRKMPEYVEDYDDDFDSTFATFVFKIPDKYLKDYDFILNGEFDKVSDDYKNQVDKVYPKLKGKLPWHKEDKQNEK